MKTLDEYIEYLSDTIKMHEDLCEEIDFETVKRGFMQQDGERRQLRDWLMDYKRLKMQYLIGKGKKVNDGFGDREEKQTSTD